MRYSTEPRDRKCVKRYGFLSFTKNMGKNLSNKYGQKLFDIGKKSRADVIKTAPKRAIQKTAEATGDLIGNKIAYKIISVSKKSTKKLQNDETEIDRYISKDTGEASLKDVPKRKATYLQKKNNKLLMN